MLVPSETLILSVESFVSKMLIQVDTELIIYQETIQLSPINFFIMKSTGLISLVFCRTRKSSM